MEKHLWRYGVEDTSSGPPWGSTCMILVIPMILGHPRRDTSPPRCLLRYIPLPGPGARFHHVAANPWTAAGELGVGREKDHTVGGGRWGRQKPQEWQETLHLASLLRGAMVRCKTNASGLGEGAMTTSTETRMTTGHRGWGRWPLYLYVYKPASGVRDWLGCGPF